MYLISRTLQLCLADGCWLWLRWRGPPNLLGGGGGGGGDLCPPPAAVPAPRCTVLQWFSDDL